MQTFSDLRRTLFDNKAFVIFCALAQAIISTALSTQFIPIFCCGFLFLMFLHHMDAKNIFLSFFILMVQGYISIVVGLWVFEIPLFFIFFYIVVKRFIIKLTIHPKYFAFAYLAFFYLSALIFIVFVDGWSLHILWVVLLNIVIDFFLALVFA